MLKDRYLTINDVCKGVVLLGQSRDALDSLMATLVTDDLTLGGVGLGQKWNAHATISPYSHQWQGSSEPQWWCGEVRRRWHSGQHAISQPDDLLSHLARMSSYIVLATYQRKEDGRRRSGMG